MPKIKGIDIDYAIDDFMIYCQQKDLRKKTLLSYESTLRLFSRYLQDKDITNLTEVTLEVCKEYIQYTKERGKYTFQADLNSRIINHPEQRKDYNKAISLTTINNYIRNVKVFFNWALSEARIIKTNPMLKIKQFKNNRKPKDIITDQEFKRLLQNIDVTKFHEFRDFCIIQLIMDSGMRIGETLSLTINDVDINRRSILIPQESTKGRKDRYVFFSITMSKLLRRWIQYKDRFLDPSRPMTQFIHQHIYNVKRHFYINKMIWRCFLFCQELKRI